ncbi:SRPBCC family protein [Massilia sp. HP4]|uniref:SRPBCC family protein n=1 Tax=Massilia sp. HP4 TaxID=2562316 RepID=UPI0010C0DC84|nr:SRPBCC family protein [Massilia sp. HP4]
MNDTNNEQATNVGKWIGAAVAGALLMYAFDPERGAKRRAHARGALRDARDRTGDRLEHAWHNAGDRLDSARVRASVAAARAGERLAGAAHAAGDRLAEASHHARDRLEHARERLADASYEAKDRASHLAHEAKDRARHAAYEARDRASHAAHDAREQAEYAADKARDRADYAAERARERADQARERLEQTAYSVKADARSRFNAAGNQVREWTDHLAQAFGSHSPTLANSALLGTGALSVVGLARRSPVAALLGLGALAVLLRSDRGRHLVDSLRQRGAASQVDVENSIHIDASPREVFDAWSEVENFPRFMSHVTEVRDLGHRRSHWVVRGPGGLEYAWNAVMTEQSRPDRLSWRSEPGSEIEQEGTVTFAPSGNGTRVTVRMSYSPPAGALGHGIARMLGADPQRQMDDDLARMKEFIERGGAHYAGHQSAPSHSFMH